MNSMHIGDMNGPRPACDKAGNDASIKPSDGRALVALRQLARYGGAHLQRGELTLAGVRRAAWLAITGNGWLLAAVLIGEGAAEREGECE